MKIMTIRDLEQLEQLMYYKTLITKKFLNNSDELEDDELERFTMYMQEVEIAIDRLFMKYDVVIETPSDTSH